MDEPTRRPASESDVPPAGVPPTSGLPATGGGDEPMSPDGAERDPETDGTKPEHQPRPSGRRDEPHPVTAAEIDRAAALAGSKVEHLVEELIEVELETGRREETIEQAERHLIVRVVRVVAGVIVLILGLVLLVAPGPGLLAIAVGLGLLAQDVPFARKLLDKVRDRLPQDDDGKLPRSSIVMMATVSVAAVTASIWFTFFRG